MPLFTIKVFNIFASPLNPPVSKFKTMNSLSIPYSNILSFFQIGNIFGSGVQASAQENKKVEKENESDYNDAVVKCPCCKWKGKNSETKKKFVFLTNISEVELFCPKCHKYIRFISDQS